MEKNKNPKNKIKIILEEKTSNFVFSLPLLILLIIALYLIISNEHENYFIYILIFAGSFIKSLSLFYKKRLILTEHKIYIYVRGKRFIAWSLKEDFHIVNYKQNFFGKIFNYGTLTLINKNKEMYDYFYVSNVETIYLKIIETYEKLMKKLDPTFIVTYINKEHSKIDKLTTNKDEK